MKHEKKQYLIFFNLLEQPPLSEGVKDWMIHSNLHVWRMAQLNIVPGETKNIDITINTVSNHSNKKLCRAVSRYFVKFRPINVSHFSIHISLYFTRTSRNSHWYFNVSMQRGVSKGYKVIIACSICCTLTAVCRRVLGGLVKWDWKEIPRLKNGLNPKWAGQNDCNWNVTRISVCISPCRIIKLDCEDHRPYQASRPLNGNPSWMLHTCPPCMNQSEN